MRTYQKLVYFLAVIFLVSSCFDYDDIDFKGVDNFKVEKFEGKKISFSMDVILENPNSFSVKIKPSVVDVYLDDNLIGKTYLDQKVKIIKRKENSYFVPLHVELEDGILMKLMKYSLKDKVKLRLVGKVKGSVYGISKKVKIDETKEIDPKQITSLFKQ
jgi:LEA14-like dessication related protein